jgi:hypothetical protein
MKRGSEGERERQRERERERRETERERTLTESVAIKLGTRWMLFRATLSSRRSAVPASARARASRPTPA